MTPTRIPYFILSIILLASCDVVQKEYTLVTGAKDSRHYKVGKDIQELIETSTGYTILLDTLGAGSISNCNRMMSGAGEIALAQNDAPVPNSNGNLRTILPLYPQLFFILYADSLQPASLRDLIVGRTIAIGPKSGGTAKFTQRFLELMGIDSTEYTFLYSSYHENVISEKAPISISVTAFNDQRIHNMLIAQNAQLWSLDTPERLHRGSLVEGFCLQYPYARPFIIPQNTFQTRPNQAILTVALDNVLLVDESVDAHVVFDLIKAILGNRELFIQKDALYNFIHDNFHEESLQFPLHEGVKDYLQRNQPTFYERYAELLALFLTFMTLSAGAISTLIRWNKRRKKERIDRYYQKVIDIENYAKASEDIDELYDALEELDQLRQKAFSQLVSEKLQSDDSFRIFITLIQDVIKIINGQIKKLHLRALKS